MIYIDDFEEKCIPEFDNEAKSEENSLISRELSKETDDLGTILSFSSDEAKSVESFEGKNTENYLSKLQANEIRFSNLYKCYPVPNNSGLNSAFWMLYESPVAYKPDGIEKFYDMVKLFGLTPISCLRSQLKSDKVNLKYYNLDSKIFVPLIEALITNTTVKILDFQENFFSSDACCYLNKLLLLNDVVNSINLAHCKIGIKGAKLLEEGLSMSSSLRDLNLSSCELGNQGFFYIANAVAANTLLQSINISNNKLDEGSMASLEKMITQSQSLLSLNLSWNNFSSNEASAIIFKSLIDNVILTDIDLSWNSLGKGCFPGIDEFISNSKMIKKMNITANRFTDHEVSKMAHALVVNKSLHELLLDKNPINPHAVSLFIKALASNEFINCPLLILSFGNLWITKDAIQAMQWLKNMKPNLDITIGGILENFTIVGPDLTELFFKTANYEAMNCKKKKERKDFGLFVLSLEDDSIPKVRFMELLNESKIKISENLANEIMYQFLVAKSTVDIGALKRSYRSYFPNVKLPELPKLPETSNGSVNKKKSKTKKKMKKSIRKQKGKSKRKKNPLKGKNKTKKKKK